MATLIDLISAKEKGESFRQFDKFGTDVAIFSIGWEYQRREGADRYTLALGQLLVETLTPKFPTTCWKYDEEILGEPSHYLAFHFYPELEEAVRTLLPDSAEEFYLQSVGRTAILDRVEELEVGANLATIKALYGLSNVAAWRVIDWLEANEEERCSFAGFWYNWTEEQVKKAIEAVGEGWKHNS